MTPQRKTSYHRLAFGARTGSEGPPTPNDDDDDDEVGLDQLEISEVEPKMNKVNSTFEKKSGTSRTNLTYDNCDDQSNLLNGTFDKVIKIIFNDIRYHDKDTINCPEKAMKISHFNPNQSEPSIYIMIELCYFSLDQ